MEPILMIHGGAGTVPDPSEYAESLERILKDGWSMLERGASALDVVERCAVALEDDPIFNAGRGSVLTEEGKVEMDAAIMNGFDLRAGSVAGVTGVRNPISLARLVMEKTEHVMLIGQGAMRFAQSQHVPFEPDEYFLTEKRIKQLAEARLRDHVVLDHVDKEASAAPTERKMGTIGAVARDKKGDLAAATSTGGITNKKFGRVGDSPIIGAGVYAENVTCAVSATGYGEQFIRTVLSKTVADIIRYKGVSAQEAADEAIKYLVSSVKGLGGIIVIDHEGKWGSAHSTDNLIHGVATSAGIKNLT